MVYVSHTGQTWHHIPDCESLGELCSGHGETSEFLLKVANLEAWLLIETDLLESSAAHFGSSLTEWNRCCLMRMSTKESCYKIDQESNSLLEFSEVEEEAVVEL